MELIKLIEITIWKLTQSCNLILYEVSNFCDYLIKIYKKGRDKCPIFGIRTGHFPSMINEPVKNETSVDDSCPVHDLLIYTCTSW